MSEWSLYEKEACIYATPLHPGWSIGYCNTFDGIPFTPGMRISKDPPSFFSLNWCEAILYLIFIQVAPEHRGKGHGEQLYDLIVEFARRLGCKEVRQTPSGGWEGQSREAYLVKRGWFMVGNEAVKLTTEKAEMTVQVERTELEKLHRFLSNAEAKLGSVLNDELQPGLLLNATEDADLYVTTAREMVKDMLDNAGD